MRTILAVHLIIAILALAIIPWLGAHAEAYHQCLAHHSKDTCVTTLQ
jgi:hypothetical protein